jgi:hypothetical protein
MLRQTTPTQPARVRINGSFEAFVVRFMENIAFGWPPVYRFEEGASIRVPRLPAEQNYLQVYLDLTRVAAGR